MSGFGVLKAASEKPAKTERLSHQNAQLRTVQTAAVIFAR
jgi:hypothetical protein